MSWQAYVDTQLMDELDHGGHLSSGAIVGLDGGVWAQSEGFPKADESQLLKIAEALNDEAKFTQLPSVGFHLGADKYFMVASEAGEVIRAKVAGGGLVVRKTNTALVFGLWKLQASPDKPPGDAYTLASDCNSKVEKLATYLVGYGF